MFLVVATTLLVGPAATARAQPSVVDRLNEADRLAWLTDWYTAEPIYASAEKAATAIHDRRNALYAKFGRLRGEMQRLPLADVSREIASDLESPLVIRDLRLRLRALTVKGDIDLEWDVDAAQQSWQQAQLVARQLGDKGWENRAVGELALVAFLKGKTGDASTMVQQALRVATESGDVGGQLRYMGAIGNGLLMAGSPTVAMGYTDRALQLAAAHPETGFPFVMYSTKVLTLLALGKHEEAEQFAKTAMKAAQAGDRRIKQSELLLMLADIADRRGQPDQAIEHLQQAIRGARERRVQRVLADAEESLADIYRRRNELEQARRHAIAAVEATETAGSRFSLPIRIGVLADIHAARGDLASADRLYVRAADIVEGIMVNVSSREAQARLVGVMSTLYTGHFRLAADRLNAPEKAFQIIERARGRAVADGLRTLPAANVAAVPRLNDQLRAISQLQTRLLKARTPADRKVLLDQLWTAERRLTPPSDRGIRSAPSSGVSVTELQQRLAVGEALIEYVLTEPRSYGLVISRAAIAIFPLPSKKQIEPLVDQFVADIRSGQPGLAQAASRLYEAVVRPLAAWQTARRVFVVPDGKLHLLPFDTLLNTKSASAPTVSSVPSANVFFLLRSRPRLAVPERQLLAMGGVPYDRMLSAEPTKSSDVNRGDEMRGLFDAAFPSKMPVLASAQAEVLAAARLVGPSSVTLTGSQATESALKAQDLHRFNILHFAVHAFADPQFPERAALVLLNDDASGEDGLLQPREIAQFRLNANVVVLSACDTAVGPTLGQEGVINIARAFLLVGAQSVVTTLWSVSDSTSMALMRRFYENITAGHDVAEALARGKRAVIEQFGQAALPTIAAFQVVGAGDRRIATTRPPAKNTGE